MWIKMHYIEKWIGKNSAWRDNRQIDRKNWNQGFERVGCNYIRLLYFKNSKINFCMFFL